VRNLHRLAASGAVLLAVGMAAPRADANPTKTVVTDPAGDTTNTRTGQPEPDPRVDILGLSVTSDATAITLDLHLADLSAPPPSLLDNQTSYYMTAWLRGGWLQVSVSGQDPGGTTSALWSFSGSLCSAQAHGSVDLAANVVQASISIADLDACPAVAGQPIGNHDTLSNFTASSQEWATVTADAEDGASDPASTYAL
jgi:hypothetical protein